MTKHYCDKCGKDLVQGDMYRADMRISGFAGICDSIRVEYCEDCISQIVGTENFAELKRRKAERQKRREELKKIADDFEKVLTE